LIIDVKPEIDAVYNGKVCLRGEWPQDDFLPYYSCFGAPVNIPRNEKERNKLIDNIEFQLNRQEDIELMVGELWEGTDWHGSQEDAKKNFKMALDAVQGKVSGIFILDTGHTYRQLFPESFETTIKEFYSELD